MAMKGEDIAAMIKDAMPDAQVEMIDLAGDNNHWKAVIISKAFEGINRVKQHQILCGPKRQNGRRRWRTACACSRNACPLKPEPFNLLIV